MTRIQTQGKDQAVGRKSTLINTTNERILLVSHYIPKRILRIMGELIPDGQAHSHPDRQSLWMPFAFSSA